MVSVILDILGLKRHVGVVVVEEDGVALFQNGNALAVDAGRVKKERTAGRP
jgi:phosphohistidine swiveling domain-containing protein